MLQESTLVPGVILRESVTTGTQFGPPAGRSRCSFGYPFSDLTLHLPSYCGEQSCFVAGSSASLMGE